MSELRLRILAGLAMIVVALLALWVGGWPFWALCALIALPMAAEWAGLQRADGDLRRRLMVCVAVVVVVASPVLPHRFALAAAAALVAGVALSIATGRRGLAFGVLYVGAPVVALVWLRHQPEGVVYTLWALALVWATDIGAYFAGRTIGGPKLAPRWSPNKTWAGLAGGVVAATLWGVFLHVYAGLPVRMMLATPLLAVAAQAGDLYESMLKRRAGLKDSGSLLPGHGGVLDRLDGLVPVAPLAAIIAILPELYR